MPPYIKEVKGFIYSPDIPVGPANFTAITLTYWNSLFHSLIFLGRMQRNFLLLKPFTQNQLSFHLVPITDGWTEPVWIQSLPKTHNRRCGNQTPDPLILGPTP